MTFVIRTYRPGDKDKVWNLHEVALKATGAFLSGEWNNDFKDIEGVYLENSGEFLVGTIDGEIVAMGAFRKISDEVAVIKRMRVYPDFQRMGFGQQIYDELEKRATAKGFKKFVLDTTIVQKSAQKFYLKNGFVEIGRKTLPVSFLDSGLEFIYYEKILT